MKRAFLAVVAGGLGVWGAHLFLRVRMEGWRFRVREAGLCAGARRRPNCRLRQGFVGVWRETDNSDVPPRGVIRGNDRGLYGPQGLAIDPEDGEVLVSDRSAIYSFIMPQLLAPNL